MSFLLSLAALVLALWWLRPRRREDPQTRDDRLEEAERRYGRATLLFVSDHDVLSDLFSDATGVDVSQWAKQRGR